MQELVVKPCPDCGQNMEGGNAGAGVKLFYCPSCRQVKFLIGGKWISVAKPKEVPAKTKG